MTCKSVLIAGSIFLWGCSGPANNDREAVTAPAPAKAPLVLEQGKQTEEKVTLKDIADDAEWRRKSYERMKQVN
ncbi:hypothetical protein [Limibacillus sp. MBR-115]|uniref:hypothetical protein n=1 Tax=Limibacillus sp. MBR-115 TaxID=3156465 RepID=UPI003395C2E2